LRGFSSLVNAIFLVASLELRNLLEKNEVEPPTLFIELLELTKGKDNDSVWRETSRWIKFEENVDQVNHLLLMSKIEPNLGRITVVKSSCGDDQHFGHEKSAFNVGSCSFFLRRRRIESS